MLAHWCGLLECAHTALVQRSRTGTVLWLYICCAVQVGYWIMGYGFIRPGEPYIPGGWEFLVRGLAWCKSLGLKAIVDLHGAPGSQNGLEHSGRKGPLDWDKGDNVQRTIDVLYAMAQALNGVNAAPETAGVVEGLELLNEPWTWFVGGSLNPYLYKDFVQRATDAVRGAEWGGMIIYSDGYYAQWPEWSGFLPSPQYSNIWVDRHSYQAFKQQSGDVGQLIDYTCGVDAAVLNGPTASGHPSIIGEWSIAAPRGMTQGVTYPMDGFWKAFHRRWFVAQMQVRRKRERTTHTAAECVRYPSTE